MRRKESTSLVEGLRMRLVAVNIAQPQLLAGTERGDVLSAIYKHPVEGSVAVRRLSVAGDAQADKANHGGPDAAVYVYALEDYAYWEGELDRELPYGTFGENFTVEGALSSAMCFGDVWRVGGVVLQVTEPRSPCYKFEHKMGIRGFAPRFAQAGRVGFYNRVLEEGEAQAGDEASVVERHPAGLSIKLISDVRHSASVSREDVERVLAADDLPASQRGYALKRLARIRRSEAGAR